jgi:LmbE family N-acetylglucosaminyl deacetylase
MHTDDSHMKQMMMTARARLATILVLGGASALPQPLSPTHFSGKRVLVVTAHPDDNEFIAGGLISAINELPAPAESVGFFIFTNGNKGCFNTTLCSGATTDEIAAMRAKEAIAAAAALGISKKNVFLEHYPDGQLSWYSQQALETSLITAVREYKPHVVISWERYPDLTLQPRDYDDAGFHPDHQASARVTLAVAAGPGAGNAFMLPGVGGPAWQVDELYFARFGPSASDADVYVSLSEKNVAQKFNALRLHESQQPGTANTTHMRGVMSTTARAAGASAKYVEAFKSFAAAWD